MTKTTAELAKIINGRLLGDGNHPITGVSGADTATAADATFLLAEYAHLLPQVQAGVVLMSEAPEDRGGKNIIITDNPKLAFTSLVALYRPANTPPAGIHPTAVVDPAATVDPSASIGAHVVIGADSRVGAHAIIYPNCTLGNEVLIGDETVIHPGAVLHDRTVVGQRAVIRANAVIGGEGFGFATDQDSGTHIRVPQIGCVVIEDDVEIGACTTIDNATFGETRIGRGTKIDNLVHLGHNVHVGEDCFIIAQVGVAGSTKIGNHVVLAGQTGVTGHITIADNVICGGKTGVVGSLKESGTYVGYPARPHRQWGRIEGSLNHLPELMKRVKRLEKLAEKQEQE